MLGFFKPNEKETASRKSFDKMQQLLFDADNYIKAGHKDVAKALLHELVREAERNKDLIAGEIYQKSLFKFMDWSDKIAEVEAKAGHSEKYTQQYGRGVRPSAEPMEVKFEDDEPVSGKSITERIQAGECISDRGTDHCPRCVDHCEAKDYLKADDVNTASGINLKDFRRSEK